MSSSTSSSEGARFLSRLAALWFALSALVAACNTVMDPFDLLHDHRWHGVNHVKSRTAGGYDRLAKAHRIARQRPDVLLLGTSRMDWAMDPDHPALQTAGATVFNAGLAGATIYEVYRYLQHAQACQPQRVVVIGIDLEMFDAEEARASFREERLAVDVNGRAQFGSGARDLVGVLYSLDAWQASRETWRESRRRTDVTFEELSRRGSDALEIPPPEERWRLYQVGVRQARHNLGHLTRHWDRIIDRMQWVDAIFAFAHDRDIDLRLYITPYHVSHLDVIGQTYGWGAFEHWKRELVRRNEVAAENHDAEPFPLWDFSGYHQISRDPPPTPENPHHLMTWYRESSHYRKVTADRILDRLFDYDTALPGFGLPLTTETVETILRKQRYHRAEYLRRPGSQD